MSHKVSVVECGNEGHSLSYLMRKGRLVFHSVIPRVDAGMQCIRICTAGGIPPKHWPSITYYDRLGRINSGSPLLPLSAPSPTVIDV